MFSRRAVGHGAGVVMVAALAVGCATIDQRMKPWMGKTQDDVVNRYGAPSSTFNTSSGGTIYTYTSRGPATTTVEQTGLIQQGLVTRQSECKLEFGFDQERIVTGLRWNGNCQNMVATP